MLFSFTLTVFSIALARTNCHVANFPIPDLSNINTNDDDKLLKELGNFIRILDKEDVAQFTLDQLEAYYNLLAMVMDRNEFPPLDPEATMTVTEMIRYHGYPVEVYQVETDDGYILTVQRIPHGKSGLGTQARKPVLIQHGFATSSPAWVVNTPPQNLPYILADVGYDVWLGNVRGSSFGYNHTHLSTKDKQFWQFSFDEMAKYDIPAVIQKMLNVTGFKQIHYIGHSMGTTILFALLSTQPKYNEIIKAGFALGPVISTRHSKGLLADAGIFYPEFHWLIDLLYNGQLKVNRIFIQFLARTLCNCPSRVLCEQLIFRITGPDYSQTNTTRYPVYFYHVPDSTSGQTMTHYYQLKYSKGFQYYDYGKAGNLKHYNTTEPPSYNLSRISAPVALFWSSNDYLADPKDVAALAPQLRNVPLIYRVPFDQFNHLDFMWAIDAKSLLYDKLITVMAKLWPNL